MTKLHKICIGCTSIGRDYIFMTDIGGYMCDICVDQTLSAEYCDSCSKESQRLTFNKALRGNVCEKCDTLTEQVT
jgi:hypothetical protein